MSIDRSILSEFIKATNDNKETKQTQLYGTVVTQGNSKCVKIDGSEIVTPVRSITDIKDDERVMVSIKDHMATVTGNMTNPSVGNDRVESAEGKIDRFDHLFAGNITAENIAAGSITTDKLLAGSITTDKLMAECITSDKISANSIESKHIKADAIESEHIKAGSIEAEHIKAGTIEADHISSGTITADKIATGTITAGSGIIADGAIGNAQISKIDAAKIEAGTIDTSKVTIQGSNGHLRLKGNRMQVFDGVGTQAKERVSVGDINGDGSIFGLRVRGADGQTILLDENGVKSEGITDGSITNDKISEDANIDGAKLNINSVVSKINEDGTETIQGTKIEVDGTTLNTKLSTITNKQTEDGERITQAQSQISANTNAIKLKVDEQTYTTDKKDMTSKLEKNTSEISTMKGQIALKVEHTDIENAKSELEGAMDSKINSAKAEIKITTDAISQNVSNLTQTVSNKADGSTVSSLNSKVSSLETSVNGISGKVTSLEKTTTTLGTQVDAANTNASSALNKANSATTTANNAQNTANTNKNNITDLQGEVSTVKSNVASLEVTTSGISQKVSSVESTTATLSGKVDSANANATNALNTANSANSKIDNLNISDRNLVKNSDMFITTGSNTNKCTMSDDFSQLFNNNKGKKLSISIEVNATNALSTNTSGSKRLGCELTVTYSDDTKGYFGAWQSLTNNALNLNKKRINNTYTIPNKDIKSVATCGLYIQGLTSGTVKIGKPKYQISDKSSDWTPAPEDIDSTINAVDGKVTTLQGTVNTTNSKVATLETNLNGITQRVSSTESTTATLTTKVNNAQNTADSANNKIDNLKVGGDNLLFGTTTQDTSKGNYRESVTDTNQTFKGCKVFKSSNAWADIGFNFVTQITNYGLAKVGDTFTYSIYAKTDDTVTRSIRFFGSYGSSAGYFNAKVGDLTNKWTQYSYTFTVTEAMLNTSASPLTQVRFECDTTCTSGKYVYWACPQLETGNKVSDYSPASREMQSQIDTHTTQITTTNSKVSSIETNLNGITSRVSSVETTATTITDLAKAMAGGKILYTDPMFKKGNNGISVYNNSNNGTVVVNRIGKIAGCPTSSTHCLEVKTTGAASPYFGGFHFGTPARANQILITRIIAKIPTGRNISWHSNATGNGSSQKWLTSTAGTGKWEEYICQVKCGTDGSFSSTNYFAIKDGSTPTTLNPLVWHIAYATVIDITDSDESVNDLTTRMSTAESKLTKDSLTTTIGNHYTTSTDVNGIVDKKGYATTSQVQQTVNGLEVKVQQSGGYNLLYNGNFKRAFEKWNLSASGCATHNTSSSSPSGVSAYITGAIGATKYFQQIIDLEPNQPNYTISCYMYTTSSGQDGSTNPFRYLYAEVQYSDNSYSYHNTGNNTLDKWEKVFFTIKKPSNKNFKNIKVYGYVRDTTKQISFANFQVEKGELSSEYTPNPNEIYDGITTIDKDGIAVTASNVKSKTIMSANGFKITKTDTNTDVFKVNSDGTLYMEGEISLTSSKGIKGKTTRKIVIANDNYCVYDGTESDVNRKVFMGFRPYNSNAQYIPSVMLGYNGINPNVDGAVVSGGTYTTYSHYPNNNNPESINLSYGALAFKYGASGTQFSTINLYQNGDIDLKAGSGIYFRPSLRNKNNHVFGMTDTEVGCRVPFKCTSTIFTNGDITTDRNIHAYGNISASGSMSCGTILPNNISIGSGLSINSNGIYTSGHITGNMVKTDSYRFTNNHIAFAKSDYNNNMMNGCHWDWQYHNLVNVKVYPVSLSLPTIDEPTVQTISETQSDTLSQIKFPDIKVLSTEDSAPPIDISNVTNKEEITTNGDVDLIKLVYLLVKDVQELKQENDELKKMIKEL